jgi:hypothetical protein
VGPRAGLDEMSKRKITSPCQESNPDSPVRSLIAIPTELSRLPTQNTVADILPVNKFRLILTTVAENQTSQYKVTQLLLLKYHKSNVLLSVVEEFQHGLSYTSFTARWKNGA